MKQVLQDLKNGKTLVVDVPCPMPRAGQVLIQSRMSLVSAGTERMLVDFGRAGYIRKAQSQPEKVRQVIDKVKTDGLVATANAVLSKLDQPLPLGYSNVGVVKAVGRGEESSDIKPGDRVVSNGNHAQMVQVPYNLCAKVPDGVDDQTAAFTVLGAIGLQGVRLAKPTLGECVVVYGLGLIGLLTVQILKAQGCRVLGIDFDPHRVALAQEYGAQGVDLSKGEDPRGTAQVFSRGRGVDGVLITTATKSTDPIEFSAHMCRKRGRIVLIGTAGLQFNRSDLYEKELSFQVSCSYGPGRYDSEYELKGHDYPLAYVRWTEQRNFEAVLDLMADGKIDTRKLVTHEYPIEQAPEAYELITSKSEPYMGIVFTYGAKEKAKVDNSVILSSGSRVKPGMTRGTAPVGVGDDSGRERACHQSY